MWKDIILSIIFLALTCTGLLAQSKKWSLENCMQEAYQNNRSLQQKQLGLMREQLNIKQLKASRLPKLATNSQLGWQFGRNIDPTTNSFNTEGIFFQSLALQSTATIYQGGRYQYQQQQIEANKHIVQEEEKQTALQLEMDVTNAYLSVLMAHEKYESNQRIYEASQEQFEQVLRDIELGVRPAKDQLQIKSQLLLEQTALADAKHQLGQSYRYLKFLIGLPQDKAFVVRTDIDVSWGQIAVFDTQKLDANAALMNSPSYRVAQANSNLLHTQAAIIKSAALPTVELFASVGTQFSSAAQRINGYDELMLDQEVVIAGETTVLSAMQAVPRYENDPYFRQAKNNFGQSVGLRLNWTFWDAKANHYERQKQHVKELEATLLVEQEQERFIFEYEQIISRFEATKAALDLAEQSFDAKQELYQIAILNFKSAAISSYELIDAKQKLNQAQTQYIQARYDCLFAYKILKLVLF